jgi:hypothetical protein
MNTHIKIIGAQAIFLIVIIGVVYFMYPWIDINVNGNDINFKSINANVIIISENPDFSNSRYLEMGKNENISLNLRPGTYYWKSGNSYIQGLGRKFEIKSEVGMEIENGSDLVNIGNVKINVTRTKEGVMVGYIVLEPNESEKVDNNKSDQYIGRQNEK